MLKRVSYSRFACTYGESAWPVPRLHMMFILTRAYGGPYNRRTESETMRC